MNGRSCCGIQQVLYRTVITKNTLIGVLLSHGGHSVRWSWRVMVLLFMAWKMGFEVFGFAWACCARWVSTLISANEPLMPVNAACLRTLSPFSALLARRRGMAVNGYALITWKWPFILRACARTLPSACFPFQVFLGHTFRIDIQNVGVPFGRLGRRVSRRGRIHRSVFCLLLFCAMLRRLRFVDHLPTPLPFFHFLANV